MEKTIVFEVVNLIINFTVILGDAFWFFSPLAAKLLISFDIEGTQ